MADVEHTVRVADPDGHAGTLDGVRDHPAVEELLVAGGEATWRAGPLAKGVGLCHGTDGNALALLELYARREVAKGYAFSSPDDYFRAFEGTFPFHYGDQREIGSTATDIANNDI